MWLTLTINRINSTMNNKKNILISASDSKISKILTNSLNSHHLKFIDKKELEYDDPNKLNKLFKDIDVYVHINYQGLNFSDDYEMIDYHTRKTYDLLFAAGKENISRVLSISTLELFSEIESNLTVTENWEMKFPADNIELLCANLSEKVCKEFARDQVFEVINLRLGSFDEKSDSRLSEKKLSQCLDKFLYLDFTTEQIKLSKNPFNSARKKGPNWINYLIQDSFEGQRYLTGKIDKFIEDYK